MTNGAAAQSAFTRPRIAIIGGGLAGLACAGELLAQPNAPCVTLFEARSKPGGRAGAFVDAATGETLDLCQHVAMGCCTAFQEFLRRYDLLDEFHRERTLHFLGPGGELCRFEGSQWLHAPLHLARAFARLRYLTWREKLSIARIFLRLRFERMLDAATTFGAWLRTRSDVAHDRSVLDAGHRNVRSANGSIRPRSPRAQGLRGRVFDHS
ncbi:MAG: FAD-dependent oxidoreductase [Pirellulales bacterium]